MIAVMLSMASGGSIHDNDDPESMYVAFEDEVHITYE